MCDSDTRTDEQSEGYESAWEEYLRTNYDKKEKIEPIDLFYPIATNLKNGLMNDCTINGKKTYVRMLIRKRDGGN